MRLYPVLCLMTLGQRWTVWVMVVPADDDGAERSLVLSDARALLTCVVLPVPEKFHT